MLILSLWLPILLSTVALFFASFLSWMVLPLHKADWKKMPAEDDVLAALRRGQVAPGNYMVPGFNTPAEQQSEAYVTKMKEGPMGVITIFPAVNMGRNLALTMLYFLVTAACLAYLSRLALDPGANFMTVFRFVSTAAFMTYVSGIVCHAIWFHCRILGHVLESIAYAAIAGAIFAALWPAV
jgi:hypothetical protein